MVCTEIGILEAAAQETWVRFGFADPGPTFDPAFRRRSWWCPVGLGGRGNLLECNLRSSVWGPLPLAFVSEHMDCGDHLMPALCTTALTRLVDIAFDLELSVSDRLLGFLSGVLFWTLAAARILLPPPRADSPVTLLVVRGQ